MDLTSQILDPYLASSDPLLPEFRKLLLQLDRKASRKKALMGIQRLLDKSQPDFKPYALAGLAMGYFLDMDFAHAIEKLAIIINSYSFSPVAIFASMWKVTIYKMLGMKRERFEAEGSRMTLIKRMAMQSDNPNCRILALIELKNEFEMRDLYDEVQTCEKELQFCISKAYNLKAIP